MQERTADTTTVIISHVFESYSSTAVDEAGKQFLLAALQDEAQLLGYAGSWPEN